MPRPTEIARLSERRRLLVMESGRLRDELALSAASVAGTMQWAEQVFGLVQSLRSLWPVLAVGAGFVFSQKRRGLLGSVGKLWSYWRIARKAFRLWRQFSAGNP